MIRLQSPASPTYEFSIDIKNTVGDWLKCSICHHPFREATITNCQHTFCRQCIEKWHETCGDLGCPLCRTPFSIDTLKPDVGAQQALEKLSATFHMDGMNDTIAKPTFMYVDVDNVDEDLKCIICTDPMTDPVTALCGHNFCRKCSLTNIARSLPCPLCNLPIADVHPVTLRSFVNMLDKIPVQCAECFSLMQRGRFEEHTNVCPNVQQRCTANDLGCEWVGPRNQLGEHAEVCPYTIVRPAFEQMRQQLGHEIRSKEEHLQKSTQLVKSLQKQLTDMRVQYASEAQKLRMQLTEVNTQNRFKDEQIKSLKKQLGELQMENEELHLMERRRADESQRRRTSSIIDMSAMATTPRPKGSSPNQESFAFVPGSQPAAVPGCRIVCGGTGGGLVVIDLNRGKRIAKPSGHKNHVYCLAQLDEEVFASGGQDSTIRIWSLTGKNIRTLEGHQAPVQCMTKISSSLLCSGSFDHSVRVWDVSTGMCVIKIDGGKKTIRFVIKVGSKIVSCCDDGSIKVLNVEGNGYIERETNHKGAIGAAIAIGQDRLATGGYDATVRIWNIHDGSSKVLQQHAAAVQCLIALNPDTLVSGSRDNKICVWNSTTGQFLRLLEAHTGAIECLCRLNNTQFVSGSNDKTVRKWDVTTGQVIQTLSGHTSHIVGLVQFGDRFASCGFDGVTKVWDEYGQCITTVESSVKPFCMEQLE
jgi:WD40 repeat protein